MIGDKSALNSMLFNPALFFASCTCAAKIATASAIGIAVVNRPGNLRCILHPLISLPNCVTQHWWSVTIELVLHRAAVFGVRKLACAFPREASFARLRRQQGDCLKTYYGAGFQPFSLLLVPYPRASPWAVIDRAFGAQIAVIAVLKAPKARSIPAWGNAP